ncbi:heme oxygenase (staphylobilin-producing) [Acidithrix ferrooxidans]|uniref:Heme oxygenase (Staphylobilin-producing) n=1 Tax=Acidithrix ferrooxidans TaxID=1280514 RepID=A0A0D8HE63_9ACTN|nr:heme oxygenase (staphylobilin-producing) [Acidithrix ferrooxidans]
MYFVVNRIAAPVSESFEKGFSTSMDSTLKEVVGLVRASLMRPNKEGSPYLATMEFESEEDFINWHQSDAFRAAHGDRGGSSGSEAPGADSYEIVADLRN